MIIERKKSEILVRLPADVDLAELQNVLDYLEYKEQTADTKAKQKDIDELAKKANASIWSTYKDRRAQR